MMKKQRKALGRVLVAAVLFAVLFAVPEHFFLPRWLEWLPFAPLRVAENGATAAVSPAWLHFGLYLIPYLIVGWDVLRKAGRNIRGGQVFDENFLMSVATLGAFGCGEYPEAVAVMLFYQVGELFQSVAVGRSRRSIAALITGLIVCYAFGTYWYVEVYAQSSSAVGTGTALMTCVVPFLLPDAVKLWLAVMLSRRMKKHLK